MACSKAADAEVDEVWVGVGGGIGVDEGGVGEQLQSDQDFPGAN